MTAYKPKRVWSIEDAQANLVEILRLSETEGPQYIDGGKTFVVTPAEDDEGEQEERMSLGKWLVENIPRGTNLVIPRDRHSNREMPFIDEVD